MRLLLCLLFVLGLQNIMYAKALANQASNTEDVQDVIQYTKNAFITNTKVAEKEFGIENKEEQTTERQNIKQYNTMQYRDIFFSVEESMLVNQALDFFKNGKTITKTQTKSLIVKKDKILRPIIKLSSIIYNDELHWSIFTNLGKVSSSNPSIGNIKIIGISNSQVEFSMPITQGMRQKIRENKENILQHKDRLHIQNHNLVMRLRVGECVFEEDLTIVTQCADVIKQVETVINAEMEQNQPSTTIDGQY